MTNNFILDTDSYKSSHWLQYPPNTNTIYSYLESRGGKYPSTVFFGLQYILKEYFCKLITMEMVEEAKEFFEAHGEPFNYEGWKYIVDVHGGKLPLAIKAVPEGSVVPVHNVLMTVENTDPNCYWLTSWVETQLLRVWYPITVATQSYFCRQQILHHLNLTSDDPQSEIDFKLHDFGSRGVSSRESAGVGGMAHLVNFMGSDTVEGVRFANHYYNSKMSAFSIPAAEHSSITSWGRDQELEAYRNMLSNFADHGALVAVVSDSYDLYNAVENLWGTALRDEVIGSGCTLVVRPDSGDPPTVVLKTIQLLEEKFGSFVNKKGYKVLNHVRVIQGDGIDKETIQEILDLITVMGYSASNVAFGMGGALLQQVNRDTQKFAYKCSLAVVDGQERGVSKDPATDPGKRSKEGRLALLTDAHGRYHTVVSNDQVYEDVDEMKMVYYNGELVREYNLDEVRLRAKSSGNQLTKAV